jgi:hypothetical protein
MTTLLELATEIAKSPSARKNLEAKLMNQRSVVRQARTTLKEAEQELKVWEMLATAVKGQGGKVDA